MTESRVIERIRGDASGGQTWRCNLRPTLPTINTVGFNNAPFPTMACSHLTNGPLCLVLTVSQHPWTTFLHLQWPCNMLHNSQHRSCITPTFMAMLHAPCSCDVLSDVVRRCVTEQLFRGNHRCRKAKGRRAGAQKVGHPLLHGPVGQQQHPSTGDSDGDGRR